MTVSAGPLTAGNTGPGRGPRGGGQCVFASKGGGHRIPDTRPGAHAAGRSSHAHVCAWTGAQGPGPASADQATFQAGGVWAQAPRAGLQESVRTSPPRSAPLSNRGFKPRVGLATSGRVQASTRCFLLGRRVSAEGDGVEDRQGRGGRRRPSVHPRTSEVSALPSPAPRLPDAQPLAGPRRNALSQAVQGRELAQRKNPVYSVRGAGMWPPATRAPERSLLTFLISLLPRRLSL